MQCCKEKIAKQINLIAESKGNQTLLVLGWSKKKRKSDSDLIATSFFSRLFHLCISKCFGLDGFGAKYRTQKLVKKLKSFNPDIMQLHMMLRQPFGLPLGIEQKSRCRKQQYTDRADLQQHRRTDRRKTRLRCRRRWLPSGYPEKRRHQTAGRRTPERGVHGQPGWGSGL